MHAGDKDSALRVAAAATGKDDTMPNHKVGLPLFAAGGPPFATHACAADTCATRACTTHACMTDRSEASTVS